MKSILFTILFTLFIVFFTITAVQAADVTLKWEYGDPTSSETAEGFRIYMAVSPNDFDYNMIAWQGTGYTTTLSGFTVGTTYQFVCRAYNGNLESANSNIVVYTIPEPSQVVVYPQQPRSLIIQFE